MSARILNEFGVDIIWCWDRAYAAEQERARFWDREIDWKRIWREFYARTRP